MKKILVIDDEPDILSVVTFRLKKAGFDIMSVMDGERGVDAAKEFLPDIILLDLRLPKLTGEEVFARLRSDERTSKIPVIILTASNELNVLDMARAIGAEGVMSKPYDPEELQKEIERLLNAK